MNLLLQNVHLGDGHATDIAIESGRIANLQPAGRIPATGKVFDAAGKLVLPALVESHIHLDKTLWGTPWHSNTSGSVLTEHIANERQVLRTIAAPLRERAGALLRHCMAQGSLTFRCHIDIDPEWGIGHVEAMMALRAEYSDLADIEFVAFPQTGMLIRPGTAELMAKALQLGVEHVGGLDPAGIDGDPIAHLTTIFDLAARFNRGVDIHLHDRGTLGLWQIERIIDFTRRYGRQNRVMISHAYCLGAFDAATLAPVAAGLRDNGISLMTAAPAKTTIPDVEWLTQQGVNVCCGSDGIRDAWSPMGTGDMLERAFLLAHRFGWKSDAQLATAFDTIGRNGAIALGRKPHEIAIGEPADLILLEAENIGDAVVRRPPRTVFSRGKLVAAGGVFCGKA